MIFFVIAGFAVGAFILSANSSKHYLGYVVIGCVLTGFAVASMATGFFSLNNNMRDTQERCMQNNGYIYVNKCVDRVPLELQRM